MILGSTVYFKLKYFVREKLVYIEYDNLIKNGGPGAIAPGSCWKDSHNRAMHTPLLLY